MNTSFVLVDAPGVFVSLVASGDPQPVRVVVTGAAAGASVTVSAVTAGGSFPVPGGVIESAPGGQIILVDNRAPLNTPVQYLAVVDGVSFLSDPITVTHSGEAVLQSLDGRTVVDFIWMDNELPREPTVRAAAFDVPGRFRPPVRFAAGAAGGGELLVRTTRQNTARMDALLRQGKPIVVRTDGTARDFPAVDIVQPMGAPSKLWGAVDGPNQMSTERVWSINYLLADDPEPGTPLSAFTWDDFDQAMESRTWNDHDALFSASDWDDWDVYDWSQLL